MNPKRLIIAGAVLLVLVLAWKLLKGREFLYAGTVEATEVDISSRLNSVIADFDAQEGRRVRVGETLARLACEDVKLAADIAERDYKRAKELRRNGVMPQENYDRFQNKRDEAALRVGWCDIKAPMDAVVLATYHEANELVSPGMKLLTLADLSEVWAIVYVPGPLLAKLSLDMPVEAILPEMKGRVFQGRVSHINDEAEFTPKNVQTRQERTRLVFGVKIRFPNPDGVLKPGMTVEVRLPKA